MTFEMELSLEHIHPELVDIKCCVTLDYFDTIEKIIILEDVLFTDYGVVYYIHKGDVLKLRDWNIEDQIERKAETYYAKN